VSSAPKKSPSDSGISSADNVADKTAADAALSVPRSRYVVYFAIALFGCAIDLVTKRSMLGWLGLPSELVDPANPANLARWRGDPNLPHRWWLIDGRLGIETSINRGALFGMAPGYWWVFATLSLIAVIGILTWLFVFRAARDRWLTVALGSITGGVLGNLYDRLGLWDSAGLKPEFQHGVRDWILFAWPEVKLQMFNPWPNFNIADSLLVTGAIMLVVHALVWREKEESEGKGQESESAKSETSNRRQATGNRQRGALAKAKRA
jgi:signal peptidase II